MKKPEMINRLSGYFDQGLDKMHEMTGGLEDTFTAGTKAVTDRAREGWADGKQQLMHAEQTVARSVKQHPMAFFFAGIGLFGLLFAMLTFGWQNRGGTRM
jgi:hypothetical protein